MRGAPVADHGFVFAATGETYVALARRAARTLRAVMPEAQIDLFADREVPDPTFDRVHALRDPGRRPKMEAMQRTRFDRTVTLDADIVVLAPVPELFDVLDGYDIAMTLAVMRRREQRGDDPRRPPGFLPDYNSGVVVHSHAPHVLAFFRRWERRHVASGRRMDQFALREELWRSRDVRLATLGYEYNFLHAPSLRSWPSKSGAPRILHSRRLQGPDPGDPETPFALHEALTPKHLRALERLLANDPSLAHVWERARGPRPTPNVLDGAPHALRRGRSAVRGTLRRLRSALRR